MFDNPVDIFSKIARIPEVVLGEGETLDEHFANNQPFVVRGLIKDWP